MTALRCSERLVVCSLLLSGIGRLPDPLGIGDQWIAGSLIAGSLIARSSCCCCCCFKAHHDVFPFFSAYFHALVFATDHNLDQLDEEDILGSDLDEQSNHTSSREKHKRGPRGKELLRQQQKANSRRKKKHPREVLVDRSPLQSIHNSKSHARNAVLPHSDEYSEESDKEQDENMPASTRNSKKSQKSGQNKEDEIEMLAQKDVEIQEKDDKLTEMQKQIEKLEKQNKNLQVAQPQSLLDGCTFTEEGEAQVNAIVRDYLFPHIKFLVDEVDRNGEIVGDGVDKETTEMVYQLLFDEATRSSHPPTFLPAFVESYRKTVSSQFNYLRNLGNNPVRSCFCMLLPDFTDVFAKIDMSI